METLALAVAGLLFIYLVYALIFPERL